MKCSSIKLSNRKQEKTQNHQKIPLQPPIFTVEQSCIRTKSGKLSKPPILSVKTLILPDNFTSFNTGSSLDKWSKKKPRLKSAKAPTSKLVYEDVTFCYNTLDSSIFLNESVILEENKEREEEEINSDIRELMEKSKKIDGGMEEESRPKRLRRKSKNRKKTIKFSKPPTPQTEQIIRVDVTSNVDDNFQHVQCNSCLNGCTGHTGMIDGSGKELKRNFNECDAGAKEERREFIVRCRQLALKQRRR